jgi:hypothetical protein
VPIRVTIAYTAGRTSRRNQVPTCSAPSWVASVPKAALTLTSVTIAIVEASSRSINVTNLAGTNNFKTNMSLVTNENLRGVISSAKLLLVAYLCTAEYLLREHCLWRQFLGGLSHTFRSGIPPGLRSLASNSLLLIGIAPRSSHVTIM